MARVPHRADNLHSRVIRLIRILLPITALVLLSTMFLLARRVNPEDAIPIAEVDVSERARERQLTRPRFTGVSQEGTNFDLSARVARPDADDPRRMSADAMELVLSDPAGGRSQVRSDRGQIDTGTRRIALDGAVRIETSTGYRVDTDRLEGTLGRLDVVAPGEVTGEGPLGTFRAGALRIDEDEGGAVRMVFTDGVNLLYRPPT
ncbi:LPS export ABC transporter periplasmic protein LptC [uncultured Jannaschia sp.]|uniref:LPS export ABC transporter periplasmic protein LptC n=1 Tax=uncultured Jannaschia sp. TaxID=293347 RepID=UPI0026074007|nr:LPS export ABC transporter periplasmic protein LptC [uncultured Jannaschia sp.]